MSSMDEIVIEGKKFISARRAADATGYEQDYIGQLSRMGKINARQIGRVWFVEEQSLLAHKNIRAKEKREVRGRKAVPPLRFAATSKATGDEPRKESEPMAVERIAPAATILPVAATAREEDDSKTELRAQAASPAPENKASSPIRAHELLTYVTEPDPTDAPVDTFASRIEVKKIREATAARLEASSVPTTSASARVQLRVPQHPFAPRAVSLLPVVAPIMIFLAILSFLGSSAITDEQMFTAQSGSGFAQKESRLSFGSPLREVGGQTLSSAVLMSFGSGN